jgi:hypothetical protein
VRRDKPARCEGVKVSGSEGRVLSPGIDSGCRRAPNTRKTTLYTPAGQGVGRLGGVETPGMHGNIWHGTREAPPLALGYCHPRSARRTQKGTAVMHEGGESDSLIVCAWQQAFQVG